MPESSKRGMLPDDLYRIAFVEDAQIAPDGGRIAFVVKRLDRDADAYRSAVWIMSASGDEPMPFTSGVRQDSAPRWSPDGRWLAFLSDRDGGRAQLWLLPANGGEACRLTDQPEAVERFAWSPQSDRITFACRAPLAPPVPDDDIGGVPPFKPWSAGVPGRDFTGETPRLQRGLTPPVAADRIGGVPSSKPPGRGLTPPVPPAGDDKATGARIVSSLRYKSNGDGFVHNRRRHIFAVSIDHCTCRQLTFGDFEDSDPAWAPDGGSIVFSSARHNGHELDTAGDIFVVPAAGGEPRRLTATLGPAAMPAYKPDGTDVAYLGHDDPNAGGARNTVLWCVAAAAGGAPAALAVELDRTVVGDWPPVWTSGGHIVFALADRGAVGVWASAATGGPPAQLVGGKRSVSSWSLSADGRRLVFTASAPAQPPELFLLELEPGNLRPVPGSERALTHLNGAWLREVALVEPEPIEYTSADGWKIEGWLTKPSGFEAGRRYPLLLNVHGGPHMYYGWSFFDETQVQAGAGYAALCLNPRGSQSYGEQFARACCNDWGGRDFEDVMNGVDEALRRFEFLDPERSGVLGGSYGGFMTSWIVGHSTRFKAAVSERAVNSLVSLFGTSDIGYWFEQFEVGSTPLAAPDFYAERSPISYADRIRTPVLIIHSENDLRCPIEQAEQLYVALKLAHKADVAFVRFPDENHELSRSGKPSRRVERFELILDWFDRYLRKDEPLRPRSASLAEAMQAC